MLRVKVKLFDDFETIVALSDSDDYSLEEAITITSPATQSTGYVKVIVLDPATAVVASSVQTGFLGTP